MQKDPPMAGFFGDVILYTDLFCGNATVIEQYSPVFSKNIPIFRGPRPEISSIALSGGQKFPRN
jgi:hypothetical protein